MDKQPTLNTQRLVLRPFETSDAKRVQTLAGAKEIGDVTSTVPHPYPDGVAETWISTHLENWIKRDLVTYAIVEKNTNSLVGCISLIRIGSELPELGYWIGVEYWGSGYCTEACQAILEFGYKEFNLKTIYGRHFARNPASGRVMEKCGLKYVKTAIEQSGRLKGEEIKLYAREFT